MFERLSEFNHVIVTGVQRSGTRICAKMIAHDTGHRFVAEEEVGVSSLDLLLELLNAADGLVVHGPAFARYALHLGRRPNTAIVWMRRPDDEVLASMKRIAWTGFDAEAIRYDLGPGAGLGMLIRDKVTWWESDRIGIPHWFEVEYHSLASHPLWVPPEQREGWGFGRTE